MLRYWLVLLMLAGISRPLFGVRPMSKWTVLDVYADFSHILIGGVLYAVLNEKSETKRKWIWVVFWSAAALEVLGALGAFAK